MVVTVLLVIAALLAAGDWLTIRRGGPAGLRWLTKLGPIVLFVVLGLAEGDADAVRTWLVVGLVLSLAGDVFLLLPERWFVAGLGSFLLAHVAYVVGMAHLDLHLWRLPVWLVIVAVAWQAYGRRIVSGASERDPAMRVPVLLYVGVISAMLLTAGTTGEPWLVAAAALFYVSDATLGTNRFVQSRPWMPVAVMVTYHLAQAAFLGFLLTR